jgi:S1-C subfamily serine protease
LQAHTIPDDLIAATQRSTAGLQLGEPLLVVGYPLGVGPTVSAGVLSGLQRSMREPKGKHTLERLIQFDSPVQSGHFGAPLVTQDGEVIGIVTASPAPGISYAVPIESASAAAGQSPF